MGEVSIQTPGQERPEVGDFVRLAGRISHVETLSDGSLLIVMLKPTLEAWERPPPVATCADKRPFRIYFDPTRAAA